MSDRTTVLVPIRYPLTNESARTLDAAGRIADDHDHENVEVVVVHVDRFQNNEDTETRELTRAIRAVLDDVDTAVITRRGFFVEEVLLEEAQALEADVIVVGASRTARWRRFLRRILGNDPAVGAYLRQETPDDVEVVEVGADANADTNADAPAPGAES